MEKKNGIKVSPKGLFIPAKYFRHMARWLEVLVSAGEIVIRSSPKGEAKGKRKWRRTDAEAP
jgi:hypothetical protein